MGNAPTGFAKYRAFARVVQGGMGGTDVAALSFR